MLGGNGTRESDEDPARKPSLVDDAYRTLKTAIRENTFLPGYQGSEQEIAEKKPQYEPHARSRSADPPASGRSASRKSCLGEASL